ncbi:MAG: DAK2 domain-containing protein [Anaerolineae bacterium]|nr:DAK2 domain-containing protein [Anaerolineae bacterium]
MARASNSKLILPGFEVNHQTILAGDGLGLKAMLRAGGQWLEAHRQIVNSLNVFPVPDGDTGTNMVLTMRSAMAEAETASDNRVETVAAAIAHGALMGARGNSGVILSQFLQGLALSLAGQEKFTGEDLARAVRQGVATAYQSVVNPVEGTILTVAREAAKAVQQRASTHQDLAVLLADMVAAAKAAEANTPELLPILKEAGVTDSGGQGLVYILEGSLRFLQGEPVEADPTGLAARLLPSTLTTEETPYGYDVQFLIQGERLNVEEIRAQVDRLGWSTLVVGNERTVKVHVHVQDPGIPLSYGASLGTLIDVVVENMEVQAKKFVQEQGGTHVPPLSLPSQLTDRLRDSMTTIGTVCVAPSQGLAHILQSLGANQIVLGGQTMNPSPQELLEAVAKIHGPDVLILPNNGNVVMAAQQAQKLADKNVRVVPTKTIPQGIAALLSLNYQVDLEANAERMLSAAQQVQTVEITRAVRDTSLSGFNIKSGDVMGLLNDELVSVGQDDDEVTLDVLAKVEAGTHEIITIYFGQECSPAEAGTLAEKIRALYPELEVEVHDGGQPYYHYIISLE